MPKFVVERNIPDVGALPQSELTAIAQKSVKVAAELGTDIQWIHSYVAGDKTYCVYHAANADIVAEHSHRAGFPADQVSEIKTVIDPATAERPRAKAAGE